MPVFNYEGLNFRVAHPAELSSDEYSELWRVKRKAYAGALLVPELDIERYELNRYMGSPRVYMDEHIDLKKLPERLKNKNQEFARPSFAIAYAGDIAVGAAFSADNVSDPSHLRRLIKLLTIQRNYRVLNDIFVDPEYQGRGIANGLTYLSYAKCLPHQPRTAYTWPKLLPRMGGLLTSWQLQPTNAENPDTVYPFGAQKPVDQFRYEARAASNLVSIIPETELNMLEQAQSIADRLLVKVSS